MKKSFSLIELLIVIIVVGILASSAKFSLSNNSLDQAVDQIMKDIYYTKHLAIIDDKYQPYPLADNKVEKNRSKYWFKQWWHFKITDAGDYIIYYVFSDSPTGSKTTTFNNKVVSSNQYRVELAKSSLDDKYLMGANQEDTGNSGYPKKIDTYKKANIEKYYGIKKVIFSTECSQSTMSAGKGNRVDILFDSYGNLYCREGDTGGDAEDINPYDIDERKPLENIAKLTLCQDKNCEKNASICIYPKTGYITRCD